MRAVPPRPVPGPSLPEAALDGPQASGSWPRLGVAHRFAWWAEDTSQGGPVSTQNQDRVLGHSRSQAGSLLCPSPFLARARGLGAERTGWAVMSTSCPQESSGCGQGPAGSPDPPPGPGDQLLLAAGSEPPACERLEWWERPRGAHGGGHHVGTCALGPWVLLAGALSERGIQPLGPPNPF